MNWIWHKGSKRKARHDWGQAPAHPHAARLEHLYGWERRCRGYDLFPQPVAPEPVFVLFDPGSCGVGTPPEPTPYEAVPTSLAFLSLRLPLEQKVAPAQAESLLGSLRGLAHPVSFEVIADAEEIAFQMAGSRQERAEAASTLAMHFPLAEVEDGEDLLRSRLERLKAVPVGYQTVDFGLLNLAYLPLKRFSSFAPDPLCGLVCALSHLREGEVAGLQVLLIGAREPWAGSLLRVAGEFGDGRYEGQHARWAREKLGSPLFACVVRAFAISFYGDAKAFSICQRIGDALETFSEPGGNELLALDNGGYAEEEHFADLLTRRSRRSGMLLSVKELAGLLHPPSEKLLHPRLARPDPRERLLPKHLADAAGAALGLCRSRRKEQIVVWPDAFRSRHCYVLGATRMGKSTLLLNLIAQDMEAGRGLCLIDPHGDLAKDALRLVPPERVGDTLYLDFADHDYPVAMGLLEAGDEWERRMLVSDVLSVLRRLFAASWGDRLEHILRHALLTLLIEPGHTLRDIRPLLSSKCYREEVLGSVSDLGLLAFWRSEFPSYSQSTFAPLYNKLGLLLSSSTVRNVVAQQQSRLHLSQLMSERTVLLVNLNAGLIGEDNAHFLGALLVSRLQIAAMQGLRHSRESRVPFTLYVDEFQHFVVSSFERILSEAGKAGLSLVMANQFLEQLPERLRQGILGNVGTLVSFRVSSDSGRLLEREFGGRFCQEDIVGLSRGGTIVRLGSAKDSVRLCTLPPPEAMDEALSAAIGEAIIARTRACCCRAREVVEAELAAEALERQDTAQAAGPQAATPAAQSQNAVAGQSAAPSQAQEPSQERKAGGAAVSAKTHATAAAPLLEPEAFDLPDEGSEAG